MKDGGPAFPQSCVYEQDGDSIQPPGQFPYDDIGGMSLRDWFAGQALGGILASLSAIKINGELAATESDWALVSYTIAGSHAGRTGEGPTMTCATCGHDFQRDTGPADR